MSLIAHYRLNGDAKDRIAGNDGSEVGMSYASGKLPLAGDFTPANGSYIIIPNGGVVYTPPKMSVAFRLYRRGGVNYECEYAINMSFYVRFRADLQRLEVRLWTDLSGDSGNVNCGPLVFNQWYHVAVTFDGVTVKVFLDGTMIHSFNHPGRLAVTANPLLFSGRNSPGSYIIDGLLEDVRIYDHDLSVAEVAHLAKARTAMISMSGQSHDIDDAVNVTYDNTTYEYDDLLKRKVAVFDGTSYIQITRPFGQTTTNQVWTVEALLYRTELGDQQFLVSGMNHGVKLSHVTSRPDPLLYLNSGVNDYYTYGSSNGMPLGQWLHVVFTFDNTTGYRAIYVNGVNISTGGPNKTSTPSGLGNSFNIGRYFKGKMAFIKFYAMSMSADEVKRRAQHVMAFDENGKLSVGNVKLLESGQYRKPIIDYSVWEVGQVGSVTGFGAISAAEKSTRVLDVGPFGEDAVVWQATNTDTASSSDGGWNSSSFPIDNTKRYRFALWMRRKVSGNGSGYWGMYGYGSVNGVIQIGSTAVTGNPYFHSGGIATDWRLYVGFMHPHDYAGGLHPDNGIYDVNGVKVTTIRDFKWLPESTAAKHRSYLYYSTDLTTVQQMAYPRIDVCDGNEPSIEQLINGFDLQWSQNDFPTPFDLRRHMAAFGKVSELGVARGLLHAYPLLKDTRDRLSRRVGVKSGTVLRPDGMYFNGSSDVDLGELEAFGSEWSVMCRYRPESFTNYPHLLSAYSQYDFALKIGKNGTSVAGKPYASVSGVGSLIFNTTLSLNVSYHIAIVYKDGVLRQYIDGVLDNTYVGTIPPIPTLSYRVGRWSSEYSHGYEQDLRIYNRAVSEEEVAWQARWSMPNAMAQRTDAGLLLSKDLTEID